MVTEHTCHVRQYLRVIRDAGITLNLEKCDFGKPEVKLVGHIVRSECRKADPERTQAMSEMARPSTRRELRKFLGAMGYYRDYIDILCLMASYCLFFSPGNKSRKLVSVWYKLTTRTFEDILKVFRAGFICRLRTVT